MNSKQRIYQKVINEAVETIYSERDLSLTQLINHSFKVNSFQLIYDCDFYGVLHQYLLDLQSTNTFEKEQVLIDLVEQAGEDNLILQEQKNDLIKQIRILMKLREIYKQASQEPQRYCEILKIHYDPEKQMTEQQLIDKHNKDKNDIQLQIEEAVKTKKFEQMRLQYLDLRQQNQQQQQQQQQQIEIPITNNFEELLQDVYQNQSLDNQSFDRLMSEVELIREIVQEMNLMKLLGLEYVTVQPYGSTVSGFSQKSSDADVSINTNCYMPVEPFLKLLKNFIDQYCRDRKIYIKTEVIIAKTPVLKYTREGQNKLELDICINNILGCVNSRMLSTLSQIHPLIRQLGIIIKTWAKANKISSKDNLSSYSFILMMFSFLFREKILNSFFIVDRQQQNQKQEYKVEIKRQKHTKQEDFETNLYYTNNVQLLQTKLEESNNKNKNRKKLSSYTLSELFTLFIDYYQENESSPKDNPNRIISIFNINPKKFETYNEDFYFNIEDPFDSKHNPGEKTKGKMHLYKDAFSNAKKFIETKQFDKLFYR